MTSSTQKNQKYSSTTDNNRYIMHDVPNIFWVFYAVLLLYLYEENGILSHQPYHLTGTITIGNLMYCQKVEYRIVRYRVIGYFCFRVPCWFRFRWRMYVSKYYFGFYFFIVHCHITHTHTLYIMAYSSHRRNCTYHFMKAGHIPRVICTSNYVTCTSRYIPYCI